MEIAITNLWENGIPSPRRWCNFSRKPSLHKCQFLESWNLEKDKGKRNHTLQCGCFGHRTFIPNHTSDKSASNQNEKVLKSVNPQEVNSLVQTLRKQPTSGNRLRASNFESLSKTVQFTKVSDLASFWHRVEAGMSHKTKPDEDDGSGFPIPVRPTSRPKIQSVHSDSRRNSNWSSHRSSHRTTSWQPWT